MRRTITLLVGFLLTSAALAAPTSAHHRPSHCGGNAPPDLIVGTPRANVLVGTPCEDILLGLGGADVLFGAQGFDILRGGFGNDRLRGVDGEHDRLNGGPGRDRCRGDASDTFLSCEVEVVRVTDENGTDMVAILVVASLAIAVLVTWLGIAP